MLSIYFVVQAISIKYYLVICSSVVKESNTAHFYTNWTCPSSLYIIFNNYVDLTFLLILSSCFNVSQVLTNLL